MSRVQWAVFGCEDDLLRATAAVRGAGYRVVDAYTPFAVHGLDRAMGLPPSRLPWVCFLCGAAGFLGFTWFQYWTSAVDWPIDVGGKPWNSWPAFVPVAFEATILFGGLGVVAALLVRCRLRPGRSAEAVVPGATDDRFVLAVENAGAARPPGALRLLLEEHGAVEVAGEVAP